jgi:hypothetical protein
MNTTELNVIATIFLFLIIIITIETIIILYLIWKKRIEDMTEDEIRELLR